MNKQERKAYLIAKHIDMDEPVDGVLLATQSDVADEMYLNDGYREHTKSEEKVLTLDEKYI